MNDTDRRRWSDGFDDDAIFADIVAHLNDEAAEAEPAPRTAAGDATTDVETTDSTTEQTATESTALPPADRDPGPVNQPPTLPDQGDPQTVPTPQVWRAHETEEDDDHFEPPPVTPLPAGDLQFWAIIAGMGGEPLLLLYLVFFNPDASSYWILTAIAISVGGFALLVSRMPGHHGDDDDGARL